MIIYVDASVIQTGNGTKENPFKTIQEAAAKALPGDEVIVAPGLYREAVNPIHAGTPDKRITYRSAIKGQAHITGSEAVKDWENVEGTVWKAVIPNGIFGDYNPFTTLVSGDWFIATFIAHTGDVYLNEKSMYEVTTLDKVKNPQKSTISWDPDFSVYTWYAEQDEANNQTIIYANFHEKDPNKENVEISVRRNCFYPESEGIGYITLSGFRISQAATQWAPPTAYQEGMVGPHWSKGWIIEDCEIYESKCSGISLGKYLQPENDNKWLKWKYKDGTQTERDCICQASYEGWDKEHIGSHIVRRCEIHDCGQTGIVGHLGGVFSVIEDNHIHHINNKQNLAGAEIGGIKMHAAIDVIFRRNHIHNCTRGLWLDWQAQGIRVSANIYDNNNRDFFIEVTHGPYLVDNNIFTSEYAFDNAAQGGAYVNNLVCGFLNHYPVLNRSTPYHFPHSTMVAGTVPVYGGDDRWFQNLFIGGQEENRHYGTAEYNGSPVSLESYIEEVQSLGYGDVEQYERVKQPAYIDGNVYLGGAVAFEQEVNCYADNVKAKAKIVTEEDGVYLDITLPEEMFTLKGKVITSKDLGMTRITEGRFENRDGGDLAIDSDLVGNVMSETVIAGPLQNVQAGNNKVKIWDNLKLRGVKVTILAVADYADKQKNKRY